MSELLSVFKRGRHGDKLLHIVAALDSERDPDLAAKAKALCHMHVDAEIVPDTEAATIPARLHCSVCPTQLRHVKERFP